MIRSFFVSFFTLLVMLQASNGFANDNVNIKAIEDKGFKQVGEILKKMSPEQLKEVVRQAESMMPELKNMSKNEIDDFTQQLLDMESTVDFQSINVQKLDPSKSKGLKKIQKDVKKYNKKMSK